MAGETVQNGSDQNDSVREGHVIRSKKLWQARLCKREVASDQNNFVRERHVIRSKKLWQARLCKREVTSDQNDSVREGHVIRSKEADKNKADTSACLTHINLPSVSSNTDVSFVHCEY